MERAAPTIAPAATLGNRRSRMMDESRGDKGIGEKPRKRWRRIDQVWPNSIPTAPREIATMPAATRQPERKVIQKNHLLKVKRDKAKSFLNGFKGSSK
jgi:hypothetical protein